MEKEVFLDKLKKLVALGKSKQNALDATEINDFFAGDNLGPEQMDEIYNYLEHSNIDVVPNETTVEKHHMLAAKHVIGVNKKKILSVRLIHSAVPSPRQTHIILIEQPNPMISFSHPRTNGPTTIGRSVVDDDDLQILIGLRADTCQRLFNPFLDIINGEDHADERVCTVLSHRFTRFYLMRKSLMRPNALIERLRSSGSVKPTRRRCRIYPGRQ